MTNALADLIEMTEQRISMLDAGELARLAGHEYDEEVIVPPAGSAGAAFLAAVAGTFTHWIVREKRFPTFGEIDTEVVASEVTWQREQPGTWVAQAYVDLGLFYSYHRHVALGAEIADFQRVLDQVASELIVTLAENFQPKM